MPLPCSAVEDDVMGRHFISPIIWRGISDRARMSWPIILARAFVHSNPFQFKTTLLSVYTYYIFL